MNLKPFRLWKGEILSLGLLLSLSWAGATPLWADTARFAYVTNGGANSVSRYDINASTGALTPVPGSPFAAGSIPFSVAVSSDGQFAYVANNAGNNVSAYTIDATTGALTLVPDLPFAAGRFPTSVTTTAPVKRCKHDEEDRDRDERGDHNEQLEGGGVVMMSARTT